MITFYCAVVILAGMQSTQFADLAFGRAQVEQFMLDRPDTAPVIRGNPALRDFLVVNFAGFPTGDRVVWNHEPPEDEHPAESRPPWPGNYGVVRVGTFESAVDKCASLVFELGNMSFHQRFSVIDRKVYAGQLNRDEFSRETLRVEFESERRTRDFFRKNPIENGKGERYYDLVTSCPDDFSVYLADIEDTPEGEYNAYHFYQKQYDVLVAEMYYQQVSDGQRYSTSSPK